MHFLIPHFHKPFKMDIDRKRVAIIVYMETSKPSKLLPNFRLTPETQTMLLEVTLKGKMVVCKYL